MTPHRTFLPADGPWSRRLKRMDMGFATLVLGHECDRFLSHLNSTGGLTSPSSSWFNSALRPVQIADLGRTHPESFDERLPPHRR